MINFQIDTLTQSSYIKLLFTALLPLLFYACNPAKKLSKAEYLLNKNFIFDKDTKIDKNDFETYIKQKPNRKILGVFRFHLWLHNMANENKIKRKRILHDNKLADKNAKRVAKGKKEKKSERALFGEWLLEISEPPVIFDSSLMQKSAKQIKLFLNSKGYFINSVSDSIHYKRRKKVDVYYNIKVSAPYTFNQLFYKIPDDQLKYYVFSDSTNSLILKGNNYDVDVIQKERDRVTAQLNNNGYFLFTKDYIYFEIDTTIGSRKVNITMGIKNFARKFNDYSDSIVEAPHKRFFINNIYIQPDFISKKADDVHKDTLLVEGYNIVHKEKLRYKTKVLLDAVFIRQGELYQLKNVDDTYKRLSELKAFKSISINFTQTPGSTNLDCILLLSPILKQSFTVETEGTNRSGQLGVSGSIVFQNRNLFKGAEVFELRLKGGTEAQRPLNQNTDNKTTNVQTFNTVQFGPEINIYFPRFLMPFGVKNTKKSNPKTIFTSALNYERRPDYIRSILNFSLGYTWKENAKIHHAFSPLVINMVKVGLQPDFENYLNSLNNKFIKNSFSNHLSTSTRYTYTYDEQDLKKQKNFSFFKLNAESSGNILKGAYDLANSIHANTFAKEEGSYTLLNVAYSQYLRVDADYRFYYNKNEINKIVFRIAAGMGKPFANFPSLPFERSFFSGGANGIRAWQSRTLGPGSSSNNTFSFDQIGDGQLEGNVELRLKLFKIINGAIFIDGGNTWLRQPDPSRVGGDFQFNRFYKEIAIGTGVGIRADFSFFIIRFDLGIKARDPQFEESKRWVLQHLFDSSWKQDYRGSHSDNKYNFLGFNIGIGYPF